MQNQLQTEESSTVQTTPTLMPDAELATEETADAQVAQTVEDWHSQLRQIQRTEQRYLNRIFGALGILLALLLYLSNTVPAFACGGALFGVGTALLYVFLILGLYSMYRLPQSQDALTREIASKGGVKAIGPLLHVRRSTYSRRTVASIDDALIQLLSHLKASDSLLLSEHDRERLYYRLGIIGAGVYTPTSNVNLAIAILKALEQVGDGKAIPIVERLASLKKRHPNRMRIKQAAIECLPALRANCGNVEANKSLLRPSQAGESAPETLLRPATSDEEAAPHQLLRAAPNDDNVPSV